MQEVVQYIQIVSWIRSSMLFDFLIQEKKVLFSSIVVFNLLFHHCKYNGTTLPYCSLTLYSSEYNVNHFNEENLTDDKYKLSFDVSLMYS